MTPRIRAAVAGAGLMGRVHALAARNAGALVTRVIDDDADRALKLATEISCKSTSLSNLLSGIEADVLHVCTPPASHESICAQALAAGLHVICEKPVTQTESQLAGLFEIADAKNRLLSPVLQFPLQRGVQEVVSSLSSLGTVRHFLSEMCTAGAELSDEIDRRDLVLDILSHPLSLASRFGLGPLREIAWQATSSAPGELVVTGASKGAQLTFVLSTRGRPTTNSLKLICERGTATMDLFHGFSFVEQGTVSRSAKLMRPFATSTLAFGNALINGLTRLAENETSFPGLRELVKQFYASVSNGAPLPIARETALDIAAARDRISAITPRA